jgi:hypothetical protein
MNGGWRHITNARMAMCVVVPRKEFLAVDAGVLDTTKAQWEFGTRFERIANSILAWSGQNCFNHFHGQGYMIGTPIRFCLLLFRL